MDPSSEETFKEFQVAADVFVLPSSCIAAGTPLVLADSCCKIGGSLSSVYPREIFF